MIRICRTMLTRQCSSHKMGESMAKRVNNDLHRYAVVGAAQRLSELSKEAAGIFAMFPGLRRRGFLVGEGRTVRSGVIFRTASPRRRRRKMSAEARKRISDAQKARWKKQKAGAK